MAQHTIERRPPPKRIVTLIRQKTSLVILSFGDSVANCVINEITCVLHSAALLVLDKIVLLRKIINDNIVFVKTFKSILSKIFYEV